MPDLIDGLRTDPEALDRRAWLIRAASGGAVLAGIAQSPRLARATQEKKKGPADPGAKELERAESGVRAVSKQALQTAASGEYQAIGDASASFMQLALGDCKSIARDFFVHYQAKGFEVSRPEHRMTLVVFRDDRPFLEFARKFAGKVPPGAVGFYSRTENWLVLYDFRNARAGSSGAGVKNLGVLAHEGTHQLTFNSGLLNRNKDIPLAFVEGLACYGEPRRLSGRNEPGLLNRRRLDDLAHTQQRRNWIKTTELLTDDSPLLGADANKMHLFYAESWLLVYTLMNSAARLPQLQTYLKTVYPGIDKKDRLTVAGKCFGDLDRLDRELRREAIRLQNERAI